MIVFSEYQSPRLKYTISEISRRWNTTIHLTSDWDQFKSSEQPGINYSERNVEGIPSVKPSGFLNEQGWRKMDPDVHFQEGVPCFFSCVKREESFEFDVFASVFFLLSRYEEYFSESKDEHGRFPADQSILFRLNALQFPVVERQLQFFLQYIHAFFPNFNIKREAPRLWVTFDIDNAWAYKNKSLKVNAGGWMKDLLRGKFSKVSERISVVKGKSVDPYDTYSDWLPLLKARLGLYRCFFLLGDRSRFDRNLPFDHPEVVKLIRDIEEQIPVGIHPSYNSHLNPSVFHKEVARLQSITGEAVLYSRFHYLRMKIPESYRLLDQAGIQEDHSMGHASQAGFRAGTCFPFGFYDIERERASSLLIVPLTIMDGTLNEYMKLTPEEAIELSDQLWKQVSLFGGDMVVLWHNETLNNSGQWKGWFKVFEHQLRLSAIPG